MLCDQVSDTIISRSLPTTLHSPLMFFYYGIDQLSIARVEINWGTATRATTPDSSSVRHPTLGGPACDRCVSCRALGRVFDVRSTLW